MTLRTDAKKKQRPACLGLGAGYLPSRPTVGEDAEGVWDWNRASTVDGARVDSAKGAYSEPLLSSGHVKAAVYFKHGNMLTFHLV